MVIVLPDESVIEDTNRIEKLMTDCAEFYLGPYGVRGECSPAIGKVWIKD